MLKSDLAAELTEVKSHTLEQDIDRCDVYVDKALSKKIGKPAGNYVTVESRIAAEGNAARFRRLSKAIADVLRELAPDGKNVLTVGLGNKLLTADALGCLAIEKTVVYVTEKYAVRVFAPGVAGVTGIESYDVIKGLVEAVAPDLVIAVDSLCASKVSRIATSFQLSDAGITPGSGVKNARKPLSRDTLGVKVISIGVPMVVYASTILAEGGAGFSGGEDMVVTPKDVDIMVENCAEIIAGAINMFGKKHR